MEYLNRQQQETLLLTIQARLERNEKGDTFWVEDPIGPWKLIKRPPTSGMIRYFTSAYQEGFDEYGSLTTKQ